MEDGTGYIAVSEQRNNSFNIYTRDLHKHLRIASVPMSTRESDGSDISSVNLPRFEGGIFVAMSTDKTFQYYRWTHIAVKGAKDPKMVSYMVLRIFYIS